MPDGRVAWLPSTGGVGRPTDASGLVVVVVRVSAPVPLVFWARVTPSKEPECSGEQERFHRARSPVLILLERLDADGVGARGITPSCWRRSLEIGKTAYPVRSDRHRFAIEHKLRGGKLPNGFYDSRQPVSPVVTIAGDEAHAF